MARVLDPRFECGRGVKCCGENITFFGAAGMERYVFTLLLLLIVGLMTACGSKMSGWVGSECYECADSISECVCPGYGGYYNPKALDLFRPGKWELLDSP